MKKILLLFILLFVLTGCKINKKEETIVKEMTCFKNLEVAYDMKLVNGTVDEIYHVKYLTFEVEEENKQYFNIEKIYEQYVYEYSDNKNVITIANENTLSHKVKIDIENNETEDYLLSVILDNKSNFEYIKDFLEVNNFVCIENK